MGKNIENFFDISMRDSVDAQLRNGSSDSFFIFSGPPSFLYLAQNSNLLCPLLFTNSFNDPDGRPGDLPVGSFGTNKVVMANSGSNPGPRSIQIGSAPLVTSHPDKTDTVSKWNFMKRLFYWLIMIEDTTIKDALLTPHIGKASDVINPIAPSINDIFTNFSRSPFYKTPFGILAIALTKGRENLTFHYYEGCTLQDVGGQLTAGMGMPIQLTGSSGAAMTYTNLIRMTDADVANMVAYSANADAAAVYAAMQKLTTGEAPQ